MAYLNAPISQHFAAKELPIAVRSALGKPLRRAAALTQLALVGSLASLAENRRHQPTALLWQSTSGPRAETLALLQEVCIGSGEPMPFDFLARHCRCTDPALPAGLANRQLLSARHGRQGAMVTPAQYGPKLVGRGSLRSGAVRSP